MTKQKWHFMNSGKCSGSFNMALDEALLEWHSRGEIGPVLRFYEWQNPTLSLGYFQRIHEAVNLEEIEQQKIDLVRRPTGGRSVLHEHEITYSVIVNERYPNMPESITEAYRVISEGLLEGFKELGLDAYFSVPQNDFEKEQLKKPKTAVCFDAPSWYELVVEGKKIAGSAQTRQKGVILQHGAILLKLDEQKLISLFNFTTNEERERMLQGIRKKAVAIDQLANREVSVEEAVIAFSNGFKKALNIELEPFTLSEAQFQYVKQIEQTKYANQDWTYKK
ncbi:MAG TPA: biotin/lipoate A/B protein ligase family protein [Sporosarcina sp.]|nr:biotin/lipoate A/B protein ligase family protein [Sporosarcina sp.]